jgi:LuxR family maltose regulon positive regulatory protein
VIAPALVTLAEKMLWMGEFGEGERWLQRAARALEADDGPGIWLRLHLVTGMLHAGRGCHQEALEEFGAAGRLQPQLMSSLALASQVTGWLLATQARLGMAGQARAGLAALADDSAGSGEPTVSSVISVRRTRPPNGRWLSPRLTGWCCRSR